MENDFIISAITGGWWPAIGALTIVLSWLLSKYRHGTPLADQLRHAGTVALGAAPWALSAGGLSLVAGVAPLHSGGVAIGVLLVHAGFTVPRPPAAKPPIAGMVVFVALALVLSACTMPAQSPELVAANMAIGAVDDAVPRLARIEQNEGLEAIARAADRAEALLNLTAVRERWAPIWASIDAIEATYAAVVEGGSPLELLKGLHGRYCETRELVGGKGVELPDVPLMSCATGGE